MRSEQFQQKRAEVLRSELRKNKELERFRISVKNGNALAKPQASCGAANLFEFSSTAPLC
ncbi:hypothetical protein CYK37_13165 [Mesorhizobium loti]|nr:hypothetical protein CYK37_13165 [Mesorhizobium loti]